MFKQAAGLGSVLLLVVGVAGCSTPVDQGSPPTAVGPEQPGSEPAAALDSAEALLPPAPALEIQSTEDRPFQTVAAGWSHSCGIRTDNSLACWGDNSGGQSAAPGGEFTTVAVGGAYTCGIRADGSVICWGNNAHGQAEPPNGAFDDVVAAGGHLCGLRADGTITC